MKSYKFKNWKGIFKISKDRGAPQHFFYLTKIPGTCVLTLACL